MALSPSSRMFVLERRDPRIAVIEEIEAGRVTLGEAATIEEARELLADQDVLLQLPPRPDDPGSVIERWV